MPDSQLVEIIRNALTGGLVWPGDGKREATPLAFLQFHTSNMHPDQLQHFANQKGLPHGNIAQLAAEALAHSVEQANKTVIDTTELARLRDLDAAHEITRRREITLECHCGTKVVSSAMTEVNAGKFQIQGNRFIAAMQQLSPECAVNHQPMKP